MSDTKKLVADPVSFLKKRKVTLDFRAPQGNTRPLVKDGKPVLNYEGKQMGTPYASPVPSRDSSALYDLFDAGKAQGSYVFPSGIPFEATVTKGKKKSTLTLEMAGNVETGVRFLPWGPDACTYMQLDNDAKLWLTGPLSGCNVYAAGDGVELWVFHTNSNKNANNVAKNNDTKRTVALNVAATFGKATPLWGHLERGYKFYNGLGYVFGTRKGNGWQNYYCDGEGNVHDLK